MWINLWEKSVETVLRLHAGVYLADTFLLLVCLFVNYLRVSVCVKKRRAGNNGKLATSCRTEIQQDSDTDTDTRLDKWPSVSAL